jgi:hypothetical protein
MIRLMALLLFSLPAFGQAWDGILDPARARDWTLAGIPGGIPTRTTVCATVTTGMSNAAIQTAIDNCTAGQVVVFGAGTFNNVDINVDSGITLRGQGANSTILSLSDNIILGNGTSWLGSWPSTPASTSWTGGLTRGSTVLTVSSTAGLSAGQTILIDETNPSWVDTGGNAGTCGSANSCGRNDSPLGFGGNTDDRAHVQVTIIVSVDSGTQITIRDPVAYDHSSGRTPQVFYWSGPGNLKYAGIENLRIIANDNDYVINMAFCTYCWVKGVRFDNNDVSGGVSRSMVLSYYGYGNVVRDSYFNTDDVGEGPTQYGIESIMSGNVLFENNILFNVTSPFTPQATHGMVIAYNYAHNNLSGNLFSSVTPHLAHNNFHLLEGNDVDKIQYDNVWGSASHSTLFRNRVNGYGANKTNYRVAIALNANAWFMNLVGNVVGTDGHHSTYTCDNDTFYGSDTYAFELGMFNSCQTGTTSYDSSVKSTLMRWGNWDAMHDAVLFCTAAGGNCAGNERGNGAATYPALASPSETFPSSFYLSAKPDWFGSVAWPVIGPDVTCSTNCVANAGGKAHKIPARLCYEASAKDGNGYLTSFDPATCYATTIRPEPPTDVTVTQLIH